MVTSKISIQGLSIELRLSEELSSDHLGGPTHNPKRAETSTVLKITAMPSGARRHALSERFEYDRSAQSAQSAEQSMGRLVTSMSAPPKSSHMAYAIQAGKSATRTVPRWAGGGAQICVL